MPTQNKTSKMVTVKTLNHTGDSELAMAIEDAINRIVEARFQEQRWVFAGSQQFIFSAASANDAIALLKDTIRLRELIDQSDAPIVVLTGDLEGGSR